jgi:hypothetical protein
MYVLWARPREGSDFELITEFENVQQKYYLISQLDEDYYKEAIIMHDGGCELYVEFKCNEKTKINSLFKK